MKTSKQYGKFFRFLQGLIQIVYPKYELNRTNFPNFNQPTILIARHSNLKGPFRILLWTQRFVRTWVLAEFVDQETAYKHYVDFTFTQRFGMPRWLAEFLAKPASFLASQLTQSLGAIPVYRMSREIIKTFRQTVTSLKEGIPVLIFPDVNYSEENGDIQEIYEGFLTIEYFYQRQTQEHVQFVAVYADPIRREIRFSPAINFSEADSFKNQRSLVAMQIQEALNILLNT